MPFEHFEHWESVDSGATAPDAAPKKQTRHSRAPQDQQEPGIDQKLHDINAAMDLVDKMPSVIQRQLINRLLAQAGIPEGDYVYSSELLHELVTNSKTLEKDIDAYKHADSTEKKNKYLLILMDHIEVYQGNILQQFLKDNASPDVAESFKKKRRENIRDTYKISSLTAQMNIVAELTAKRTSAAIQIAKSYIRKSTLSITDSMKISPRMQNFIDFSAKRMVQQVQTDVVPVIDKKISEFAKQGFVKTFWGRAKQTGAFAYDWVATPFSKDSRDRMASGLTPVAYMGPINAARSFGPILYDLAKTSYNVSLSRGQMMELLTSISGAVVFDAALVVATWGGGAAIKGSEMATKSTQATSMAVRGLSALSIGFGAGKTVGSVPYVVGNTLTFDSLHKNIDHSL